MHFITLSISGAILAVCWEYRARIARVLLPAAFLNLYLTGDHVTDMSDAAGTSWLDTGARDWSDALLAAAYLIADLRTIADEGGIGLHTAAAVVAGAVVVAGTPQRKTPQRKRPQRKRPQRKTPIPKTGRRSGSRTPPRWPLKWKAA